MTSTNYRSTPPRLDEIYPNYESPLFFVTFNVIRRRPILATPAIHAAFRDYCTRGAEMSAVIIGRYVIMPDHVHLFVHVISVKLGEWIKGLKRAMSAAMEKGNSAESNWQPGFFDHLLRTDESYAQKWEYVRLNPVRAGLVANADDWPYQGEIVSIERL